MQCCSSHPTKRVTSRASHCRWTAALSPLIDDQRSAIEERIRRIASVACAVHLDDEPVERMADELVEEVNPIGDGPSRVTELPPVEVAISRSELELLPVLVGIRPEPADEIGLAG